MCHSLHFTDERLSLNILPKVKVKVGFQSKLFKITIHTVFLCALVSFMHKEPRHYYTQAEAQKRVSADYTHQHTVI